MGEAKQAKRVDYTLECGLNLRDVLRELNMSDDLELAANIVRDGGTPDMALVLVTERDIQVCRCCGLLRKPEVRERLRDELFIRLGELGVYTEALSPDGALH